MNAVENQKLNKLHQVDEIGNELISRLLTSRYRSELPVIGGLLGKLL